MNILFTRSNKKLSKAICRLTKEPVSHVALQFGKFIVHSNLLGIHIEWAENFKKHSQVVFSIHMRTDNIKLSTLMSQYEWKMYDFGAMLFLGLSLFLRNTFKIPLPKANLWQSSGMFLCTEFVTKVIDDEADSMITPYKLYLKLYDKLNK